jgi:hypothetical protein
VDSTLETDSTITYTNVGVSPQLILGCRWYALLLARSVNTQLALCRAWGGALCYWSAVGCDSRETFSWSRLTAMLLWRLLGVLLFTGARSMRRAAVHWRSMKPESWSGWFPLKSSPTCSYRWLHCYLQNVHANCTAGKVCANWSESSSWLDWTELTPFISLTALRRTQV